MPNNNTINLFIDTQVFVKANFNLCSGGFDRLHSHVSAGQIKIFSTTITRNEIYSHIDQKVNDAFSGLRKFQRHISVLSSVVSSEYEVVDSITKEILVEQFRDMIDQYFLLLNVEVLSLNSVSSDQVFEDYFEQNPPFSSGKKKCEFPDAFVAAALNSWCDRNNDKMVVITEDNDWISYCEQNENITCEPRIFEVLALLPDPVVAEAILSSLEIEESRLLDMIAEEFPAMNFYLDDLIGEVRVVSVDSVSLGEMLVLEAEGGEAVVEIDCEIAFTADATYEEIGSFFYDSEEKTSYHNSVNKQIYDETSVSVELRLVYSEEEPIDIVIASLHLPADLDVWIDSGELDL